MTTLDLITKIYNRYTNDHILILVNQDDLLSTLDLQEKNTYINLLQQIKVKYVSYTYLKTNNQNKYDIITRCGNIFYTIYLIYHHDIQKYISCINLFSKKLMCDMNYQDKKKITVLLYVLRNPIKNYNTYTMAKVLLENNTDIYILDKYNKNAIDYAEDYKSWLYKLYELIHKYDLDIKDPGYD